jgi:DNA polymerase-4
MGHHLYNLGQLEGSWKAPVHQDQEIKSMGHMYTLPQEYRKPQFFLPVLYKLCEMVGRRLRKKNLMGNIVSCYYHDKDYIGAGDSKKLKYYLQDGRDIFSEAVEMLNKHRGVGEFKLIGITVAGLRPYQNQLSLFGRTLSSQRPLLRALDKINDKYGEFTVLRAQMLPAGKVFRDSIGFGRVKELAGFNPLTQNRID